MKINWFKVFLFVSLFFLLITLYKAKYLVVPEIYNISFLFYSLVFLFVGFMLDAASWTNLLRQWGYSVDNKRGITSSGISIFGKYIPGKVWVIIGRAEYIAKELGYSRRTLSNLSLTTQLLSLWVGLLFGIVGLISVNKFDIYGLLAFALFVILSLFIYTPVFHNLVKKILFIITRKDFELPRLSIIKIIKVLPWFIGIWGAWTLSFYFLSSALMIETASYKIAWGFSIAASLGVLAIIAPGGLGVREGVLTAYLVFAGIEITEATTIAITSRLWFLSGEFFIFFVAVLLQYFPGLSYDKK